MEISIITNDRLNNVDKFIEIGIKAFEITLNEDPTYFIDNFEAISNDIKKKNIKIASLGQWGSFKCIGGQLNLSQLEVDKQLVKLCSELGSTKYVTGFNRDEAISKEENIELAISYFQELVSYTKDYNVDICLYNCDWNNFILGESEWSQIIDAIPDLKIKYDPSHSFYRDQNYLEEIATRISDIGHIHVKGGMKINNIRYDDPPAFMDQIDWNSIFSILNIQNYNGYVSIEPHSENIETNKMLNGIKFTYKKLCEIII